MERDQEGLNRERVGRGEITEREDRDWVEEGRDRSGGRDRRESRERREGREIRRGRGERGESSGEGEERNIKVGERERRVRGEIRREREERGQRRESGEVRERFEWERGERMERWAYFWAHIELTIKLRLFNPKLDPNNLVPSQGSS